MLQVVRLLAVVSASLLSLSTFAATREQRTLLSFTDMPHFDFSSCEEQTFCTREYRPAICTVNGVEARGSNRCEAMVNLRKHVCLQGFRPAVIDVSCSIISARGAL